jgi:hypothetical protein
MPFPAIRNITIHQNIDWSETFNIKVDGEPMQLAGYTIVGKCRKGEDVTSALVFPFSFSISGTWITVSVPASVTAAIDLSNEPADAQYFYDFTLIEPSTLRRKILKGRVTLERTVSSMPSITRSPTRQRTSTIRDRVRSRHGPARAIWRRGRGRRVSNDPRG